MDPRAFYSGRIQSLEQALKKLQKKKSTFAWARLAAICCIIFIFYLLLPYGFLWIVIIDTILAAAFIRLVYADIRNQTKIDQTKMLIEINEDEIRCLDFNFLERPSGSEFADKEHPYTSDLDIFGRASLYQYINRSHSEMGNKRLASYLSSATSTGIIAERQKAAKELSENPLWMQNLQLSTKITPITFSTQNKLEKWMEEPPIFLKWKGWNWLRYLIPALIITVIVLFIYDIFGYPELIISLFISGIIAYRIDKYAAPIHQQLSKVANELNSLSQSIAHIEALDAKSGLLKNCKDTFNENKSTASMDIRKIRKILDRMDLRYNMVLGAPLNIILLWNLQQVLDLEKWKSNHPHKINQWFNALAEMEAIASFGVLLLNHPNWVFPTITNDYFYISGKEIGHPLIAESKRVNNFIDIPDNDHIMLVTGSNMAGKSTYLRSVGVNVVLALAGAPVCAQSFSVSHVNLISSMRITDNLEENTSTFYAELKKLKTIIEKVNAGEHVFILLDEILRGTNSLDRHTGSKALIKQLIKRKAVAVIATHDLELAQLQDEDANHILNFHFDVQVNQEELYFDYRLKTGICTSLNASILMKKIGIEL